MSIQVVAYLRFLVYITQILPVGIHTRPSDVISVIDTFFYFLVS